MHFARPTCRPSPPIFVESGGWPLPRHWVTLLMVLLLIGCSSTSERAHAPKDVPPGVRGYKVGKPYRIKGTWYYPSVDYDYSEVGVASWYGPGFHGRSTANGEQYDMNDLTAAHRTLPMPSVVRVTNLGNGRSIKLRVNDRGPFVGNRIIDVSRRAAQLLGFHIDGTARVQVEIVADESKQLAAALGVPIASSAPERPSDPPIAEIAAAYEVSTPVPPSPMPEPEVQPEAQAVVQPEIQPQPETQPEVRPEPRMGEAAMAYMPATAPEETPETRYTEPEASALTHSTPPETGPAPELRNASSMYVQAGAFADADRADLARQRLSRIGPIIMSPSRVNGRELLRVRVGPLFSDHEAERVLASVSRAGFPDCRLVVE
jgi:rare lipoprotein A